MISLETLAASVNIDVEILKNVFASGYSRGYDDGYECGLYTDRSKAKNEIPFEVNRTIGQKE